MPNHFYFRDHADGTGTASGASVDTGNGVYTSRQTGDWDTTFTTTAFYFESLADCFSGTVTPVAGDSLYGSDIHSHSYSANTTIAGPTSGVSLAVYSVDDTDMAVYKVGAVELATAGNDLLFSGQWQHSGTHYEAGDDVGITLNDSNSHFYQCVLRVSAGDDAIGTGSSGGSMTLVDSELKLDDANARILGSCTNFNMAGGSITTTSAGINNLFEGSIPTSITLEGVDITAVTGTIFEFGAASGDAAARLRINDCKLASGVSFLQSLTKRAIDLLVTNSTSVSAASEHQFYQESFPGTVEDQDDSGIHRDESTAFDGGKKVSFKIVTTSDCGLNEPLSFNLPARFSALSNASTDTVRIYFAVVNTVTLTDTNCWAELIYPDGTTKQLYNFLTNRNSDILAAGTEHTDDSGGSTWKNGGSDLTAHNEYRMDLDTSGDAGADSVPIVRIYVAEPSITVYFDTTIDLVA